MKRGLGFVFLMLCVSMASAAGIEPQHFAELSLRIHIDCEYATASKAREVRTDIGDESRLGAATFFVDERDEPRTLHSLPRCVPSRCRFSSVVVPTQFPRTRRSGRKLREVWCSYRR